MSHDTVSAIVVSYETGPRLKECLYALSSDPQVDQIVIVDNGNPPEAQSWVADFAEKRPGVGVITGHGNVGFGAAVNLGVAHADGPHILVINPDAVLRRNSVAGMQAAAADLPDPWIVGGRTFNLLGQEDRGPRRRELTLWRAVTSLLGCNTWTLEGHPAPKEPIDMPVVSGAFFLTSKSSMASLEGFDETYFLHVEDVDLCRRCREAGGRVIYDPKAGALHYGSTAHVPSKIVAGHKADSLEHYFRKYARGIVGRLCVAVTMPMMRVAMAITRR